MPKIGSFPKISRGGVLPRGIQGVRSSQQRRYFNSDREGRIARIFFPSILLRHRPVTNDKTRSSLNHSCVTARVSRCNCTGTPQQIVEQNWKAGLIDLHALPIRSPIKPGFLRPMSVAVLCRLEIVENRFGAGFATRREQAARCLNGVARPNQMIPAEIFISLRR